MALFDFFDEERRQPKKHKNKSASSQKNAGESEGATAKRLGAIASAPDLQSNRPSPEDIANAVAQIAAGAEDGSTTDNSADNSGNGATDQPADNSGNDADNSGQNTADPSGGTVTDDMKGISSPPTGTDSQGSQAYPSTEAAATPTDNGAAATPTDNSPTLTKVGDLHVTGSILTGGDGQRHLLLQDDYGHQTMASFDGTDTMITYELDGKYYAAKVGSKLTILDSTADFVNYYNSDSDAGELVLQGDTAKTVHLDGSRFITYDGFTTVDASQLNADVEIAGSDKNDRLMGGKGTSSLWGGAGGNDVLVGGTGHNVFYFGKNNGSDLILNSKDSDVIKLFDVSKSDIRSREMSGNDMVITLNDGSALTIKDFNTQGACTLECTDGKFVYEKTWTRE